MMFGFFTDTVENVLDIAGDLLEGEAPSKRQLAKLVDAGLTVYAISEATGIAVDVLEGILEND
jgi:hypothetical protein